MAYLDAALAHLTPVSPTLAAVGGLSGTGKSTFARLVAPGLGAAPGAVVLRTDEVRKRLMGVAHNVPVPPDAYGPTSYDQVYDLMFAEAQALLAAGRAAVLDATFLQPQRRVQAEALADQAGVRFLGVWLEAPPEILAPRILGRTGDASDASLTTLSEQLDRDLGPITWARIDATGPAADSAEAWSIRHAG